MKTPCVTLIDNYDSFTYNLMQYCAQLGASVRVFRNDALEVAAIPHDTTHIIISPGPCAPKQAGISCEVIRQWGPKIPLLGVCLGHQCIGEVFGGIVSHAKQLMHGKTSLINHDSKGVFLGLPQEFSVVRYHSLAVEEAGLPDCLEVSARVVQQQEQESSDIMGLRHKTYPIEGVQFHPEAYYTEHGMAMLKNFLSQ